MTERHLSPGTIELIRKCRITRAVGKMQFMLEVAQLCRGLSTKTVEEITRFIYSDLFNIHSFISLHQIKENGYMVPKILPFNILQAMWSLRIGTSAPKKIRSQRLNNRPSALIKAHSLFITRCHSKCKIPNQWRSSKTVLEAQKRDLHDIGDYHPTACSFRLFYRPSLGPYSIGFIRRKKMKDSRVSNQGFRNRSLKQITFTR